MLKNILIKKNLNLLSGAPKNYVIKHKNLQIVTRQGTKTRNDNIQVTRLPSKDCNYPQINQQKYVFNNASRIFKELAQ